MTPGTPDAAPAPTQVSDGAFYPLGRADGSGAFGESYAASGTAVALPPLEVGTLLKSGRYRLVQPFNAPPANTQLAQPEPPLWAASDAEQPGARVLIQELPLTLLMPERADAIQRQVASRLEQLAQAPGFPRVIDVFTERRRRFITFVAPDGQRLSELVRARGAMPEVEVVRLGVRLADLLTRMEQAAPPVIHGNISAENVLLRPDGGITLIGYSPTLLVQSAGAGEQGSAGGAKGYAAPEQMGGLADSRTDIFGAGILLYFAATGYEPTRAGSKGLPPARKANGSVSRGMEAVLARALQPNLNERYQTALDLLNQLSGLVPQEQLPDAFRAGGAPMGYAGPATSPGAGGGPGPRYAPLTGAVGALRASMAGELPPGLAAELKQQGKRALKKAKRQAKRTKVAAPRGGKRKRRPVLRFALILLVLAGLAADGYFYATQQMHLRLSDYLHVFAWHLLARSGQ